MLGMLQIPVRTIGIGGVVQKEYIGIYIYIYMYDIERRMQNNLETSIFFWFLESRDVIPNNAESNGKENGLELITGDLGIA